MVIHLFGGVFVKSRGFAYVEALAMIINGRDAEILLTGMVRQAFSNTQGTSYNLSYRVELPQCGLSLG